MPACALPFRLRAPSCLLQPWPANRPPCASRWRCWWRKMCCWRSRLDGCRKKSRTCVGRCTGTAVTAANPLRRTVRSAGDAACTVGRAGGRGAAGPSGPRPPSGGSLPSRHSWPYPLRVTCSSRQYRHWRIRHRHCLHACAQTRMEHLWTMHDKPPTHGCLRFGNRMRFHPRTGTRPLY